MILGSQLIIATACLSGLQAGLIQNWAKGLFTQTTDGNDTLDLTPQEKVYIVNSQITFKLIGSGVCAYLMENLGRRPALIILTLFSLLGWLPNFIGSTVWWFCLSQALHGIYINVYDSLMPVVVGETIVAERRGAVCTATNVGLSAGKLFSSLLAQTDYTVYNAVPVIPSFLMMTLVVVLQETPYFSMFTEGSEKARKRFIWLSGKCNEEELNRLRDRIQLIPDRSRGFIGSFCELLIERNRKALCIVLLFATLATTSGYDNVTNSIALVLPKSSISASKAVLIISVAGICSSIVSLFLVDRVGRKPLTFVSFLAAAVSFFTLSVWYYLRDHTTVDVSSTLWVPLVFFMVIELFCNLGSQHLYHILIGEMFSVNISGRATMIVTITISIVLALINQAFIPIKTYVGTWCNLLVYSIFNLFGCVCCYVILIETKGKTLEDIQTLISSDSPLSRS